MIRHVNRSDDQTNSLLSMMKHEQKQKLKKKKYQTNLQTQSSFSSFSPSSLQCTKQKLRLADKKIPVNSISE